MILLIFVLVALILYALVMIGLIEEEIEKSEKWSEILRGGGRDE